MKFSRTTLAATLCSALVLSACTGQDPVEQEGGDPAPATQTADTGSGTAGAGDGAVTDDDAATADDDAATGDAAGATADAADATADAAGSTADDEAATTSPDDLAAGTADDESSTEVAMSTDETTAAITLEEAEEAARTVLTARFEADQGDGDDIRDLQRMSMMGSVRQAHEAADQLEEVNGEPTPLDLEESPVEPNVLAISRDDGELPMFLLVQTVPEDDGVPLLHLLESRTGETKDFRISWEAPMLPGTELPSFDRRSVGSPVLRSGSGDLQMSPRDLLRSVAAYISYPQPEDIPDYRTHGYAPAVRRAAQNQAEALSGQATLREKNWLISQDTHTLLFDDGSAFVMGTLLRDTQFRVNSGSELNPPPNFRVFQDSPVLTGEAVLRTMVFIGMRAPSEDVDFKPEMIAAREQLVDAWGD